MKLVRLAVVTIGPKAERSHAAFALEEQNGVTTHVSPTDDPLRQQLRFIAKAFVDLPELTLDCDGLVAVPDEHRERCESSIMRAADLLAIATRGRRQVGSATPPAALIPENDTDRALLARALAMKANPPQALSMLVAPLNLADVGPSLVDRWDGVAMLAEAYSHFTLGGRYRDLVRFFELAFSQEFMKLGKKLVQTLSPPMGYRLDEIRDWQALRHAFSHADGKIAKHVAFSNDARSVVQRMEQAALDILFNKAEWRKWSSVRRTAWSPTAMTTNRKGTGVIRQGSRGAVEFLLLDEFGVFPRLAEFQHTNLPRHWWHRFVPGAQADAEVTDEAT